MALETLSNQQRPKETTSQRKGAAWKGQKQGNNNNPGSCNNNPAVIQTDTEVAAMESEPTNAEADATEADATGENGAKNENEGDGTDTDMEKEAATTTKNKVSNVEEEKKDDKGSAEDAPDEEKDEEEKKEPPKKKYTDWPLKNINEPHDHDVLYGRGGGTNHHPGNKRYRKMVEDKKLDYVNSKRLDKPLVALEIIKVWRDQDPPGRFLKLDGKTGLWNDVGDKKAREKTSQALREKAPMIRKQQEEERMAVEGGGDGEKLTRFAEGTKDGEGNDVKKPAMARDTSLGPLAAGSEADLVGFSWQDGVGPNGEGPLGAAPPPPPPQQPPYPPHAVYPPHHGPPPSPHAGHYRYGSSGSIGSMGPPPPPGGPYIPTSSIEDRRMQFTSSGRYESWGSHQQMGPPGRIQSGGSWGAPEHGMTSREHSFSQYPLPNASIGHPATYAAFDGRSGSYGPAYPGAPPPPYGPPPYHYSSAGPPPPPPPPPPVSPSYPPPPSHQQGYPGHARTPSGPLGVDPAVASAWSGKPEAEIVQTLSSEEFEPDSPRQQPGSPSRAAGKPEMIKRATSNQNETIETKPDRVGASVKRAALNRDSSRASNRLKDICFPGQFKNGKFDATKEMNELSEDMYRSRLTAAPVTISEDGRQNTLDYLPPIEDEPGPPRPEVMGGSRTTTLDMMAMDLAVQPDLATRPKPLGSSSRSSTIEGLALEAVDDALLNPTKPEPVTERTTTMDFVIDDLQKPGALGLDDRMTSGDFLQIVDEPLSKDNQVFTAV